MKKRTITILVALMLLAGCQTLGVVVSSAIVILFNFVVAARNIAHFFAFPVDFPIFPCIIEVKESQEVSLCNI